MQLDDFLCFSKKVIAFFSKWLCQNVPSSNVKIVLDSNVTKRFHFRKTQNSYTNIECTKVAMCNCLEEIVFKDINEISCTSFARSRNYFKKLLVGYFAFAKHANAMWKDTHHFN